MLGVCVWSIYVSSLFPCLTIGTLMFLWLYGYFWPLTSIEHPWCRPISVGSHCSGANEAVQGLGCVPAQLPIGYACVVSGGSL